MLNFIGYEHSMSVEWEDAGMDRLTGGPEALEFVRKLTQIEPARRPSTRPSRRKLRTTCDASAGHQADESGQVRVRPVDRGLAGRIPLVTRPAGLNPVESLDRLSGLGAWGVSFHDDLVAFDADDSARRARFDEWKSTSIEREWSPR